MKTILRNPLIALGILCLLGALLLSAADQHAELPRLTDSAYEQSLYYIHEQPDGARPETAPEQFWILLALFSAASLAAPLGARALASSGRPERVATLLISGGLVVMVAVFASASQPARASGGFQSSIPNGDYIYNNNTTPANCQVCHIYNPGWTGSGTPGSFSLAISTFTGGVAWGGHGASGPGSAAYNVDTDGDGFTNGEELQDPDGTWVYNALTSNYRDTSYASNPNDAAKYPPAPFITNTTGLVAGQTITGSLSVQANMRYAALNRLVYSFRTPAGAEVYSQTVNSPALTNYANRFCLGASTATTSSCAPWDPGLVPNGVYTVVVRVFDRRLVSSLYTPQTGAYTITNVTLAIVSTPRFVAPSGANVGNCSNNAAPCATVQYAVDQANAGDEVRVAAGTYIGVSTRAGLTQMAYISKTLTLRGGYALGSWGVSDPIANPTTLNAQGLGRVIYLTGAINATIANLRLTGGNAAAGGGDGNGGGVHIDTAQVLLARNSIFSDTAGGNVGGGIYLISSLATLSDNTIMSNTAGYGGGVGLEQSNQAILSANVFISNTASVYGGGIRLNQSNASLVNNVFIDNFAGVNGGGGVGVWQSQPALIHNTFVRNTSVSGAAVNVFPGTPTAVAALTNTILVSQTNGTAVVALASTTATVNGVLWFGNLANTGGAGVVNVANQYTGDPAFTADGYHLTVSSAAFNRGVNAGIGTDVDGDARPQLGVPDLGADEFVPMPPTSVAIVGPTEGLGGVGYAFTATVSPAAATFPITYTWQASEQTTVINSAAGLANSVVFTWTTPGAKVITVTAANLGGSVVDAHQWTYTPPSATGFTFANLLGPSSDTRSMLTGDFDGDGSLDIALGYPGAPARLYLNDGAGNFTLRVQLGSSASSGSLAIGDLNGDARLDVVLTNVGAASQVFFNDGSGLFPTSGTVGPSANGRSVAIGDVNNDGALDVVLGYVGQPAQVFLNTGAGAFNLAGTLGTLGASAGTTSISLGDLNSDGALDIVLGNYNQNSRVFLNTGPGTFNAASTLGSGANSTSVALGDLNGDFALDVVLDNLVYLNNGIGGFSASSAYASGANTFSVTLGDVNGDGTLDIVLGNGFTQPTEIYLNNGVALFHLAAALGSGGFTRSVLTADLNNDGALDIVLGNTGQPNQLFVNNGAAGFGASSLLGGGADTYDVAVGDLNGDNALDIVLGNSGGPLPVYLNDSTGRFPITGTLGLITDTASQSVALGDLNGDGALDAVLGSNGQTSRVFFNNGLGSFAPAAALASGDATQAVALGDVDNNGFLDIVLGNNGQPSRIHLNSGGSFTLAASLGSSAATTSAALGDLNADGALDIVLGNYQQPSRVYFNTGSGSFGPGAALGTDASTYGVALSDFDGDGLLDIALGNFYEPVEIYHNDGNGQFTLSAYVGSGTYTHALAVQDFNGDGAQDIALANGYVQPSQVYLNNGSGQFTLAASLGRGGSTYGMAAGDLNGDGAPDIVLGNYQQASQVFLNGGGQTARLTDNAPRVTLFRPGPTRNAHLFSTPVILDGQILPIPYALFDLEGNPVNVRAFYSQDGGGRWFPAVAATNTITSHLATLGNALRFDGVDSYVQVGPMPALVMATATTLEAWIYPTGPGSDPILGGVILNKEGEYEVARFANGTIQVAFANTTPGWAWVNTGYIAPLHTWTHVAVTYQAGVMRTYANGVLINTTNGSGAIGDADPSRNDLRLGGRQNNVANTQYFQGLIDEARIWNVTRTQPQIQADMARTLSTATPGLVGYWRFNEGRGTTAYDRSPNQYHGALVNGPAWARVALPYVFNWDTFRSGYFGQSDNTLFRLEAYTSLSPTISGLPGPYQFAARASQTFPFRVRGTQIRVITGTTTPVGNAMVFRLAAGQTVGGALLRDGASAPFRTNNLGYLQGRGQVGTGDRLFAMVPITWTENYTLYHTSGTPVAAGLEAYTLTVPGVQTLTVTAGKPLYLFNLKVALEWDASQDPTYLDQLSFNLQRASEYLYDFTNGQVALGDVYVTQNADDWAYANVLVHANNRLRPFAAQGGVVLTDTVDPQHSSVLYGAGQIHIGSTWNRYGQPGVNIGDDWPLILAHELSHYLLFHDDTYLGVKNGQLIPVSTCTGSAMGDIYNDPNATEFIWNNALWTANCAETLPAVTLGRNEWQTMSLWYPGLISPTVDNPGPSVMPFDLTNVRVFAPITATAALVDPTFYLNYSGGGGASSEARAFLIRTIGAYSYTVDLGAPFGGQNRVIARGAQSGDRLCVFDRQRAQYGCEIVESGDDQMTMEQDVAWAPVLAVTPVNSTTLTIQVSNLPPTLTLQARLYPEFGGASPIISLNAAYSGTFALAEPTMAGTVQLWVNETATENNPRRETMVAFAISGNPGVQRAGGGVLRAGGGVLRAGGGVQRAGGGVQRAGGAPVISPDGQMIFFSENPLIFAPGQFYAIQAMAGLPALPPGRTVIGQGYRLVATPGTPVITGSVSIQYLSNDVLVAGADENQLTLYFFNGTAWQELATTRNPYFNVVTAPSQGVGIYALMSSIQIPLYRAGWNLFAYPLLASQPISNALLSIAGKYELVYGYVVTDTNHPWRVFDPTPPVPWVNDLTTLSFGNGYWISATQAVTIHLSAPSGALPDPAASGFAPLPPATFYGYVQTGNGFTPTVGLNVVARVNGLVCGTGLTLDAGSGQIGYVVNVSDDNLLPNCGARGAPVTFTVASQPMSTAGSWNDNDLIRLDLLAVNANNKVFLPLILR